MIQSLPDGKNSAVCSCKRKRLLFCIGIAFLICLIIYVSVLFVPYSYFRQYEGNIVCSTENLVWNTESGVIGRSGCITPFTSSRKTKNISKKSANSVFQYSNFYRLLSNDFEHYAAYDAGKLNSLNFTWNINNGVVKMLIDPENSPDYLFGAENITQYINGYNVSAKKSDCYDNKCEIDIGLKKDGICVWIFGNSENEAYINELFNLVLNSDIDLSSF